MASMSRGQLLRALLPAGLVFVLQKVDLQELGLVPYVVMLFAGGQAVCFGLLMWIRNKIGDLKDSDSKVHVPPLKSMGVEVKPAAVMTIAEYDDSKLWELINQQCVGALIVYGMYTYWGYFLPMIMQVVMAPMNLLDSPLGKVHLQAKAARGELGRPWPQPNPFGFLGQQSGPQTAKQLKQEAKKEEKKKGKEEKKKAK